MNRRSVLSASLVLGAVLLVAGCSSSASSSAPAPAASSASAASSSTLPVAGADASTLAITGFTFSTITVKPGATVTVTNADTVAHTVKVNGTQIDVNVPGGGQATFTAPTKPGSYPLTCDFHPTMHGSLTVAA